MVEKKARMKLVQGRVGGGAPKRVSVDPLLRNCGGKGGAVKEVFGVCLPAGRNYFFPDACIKKNFKILF